MNQLKEILVENLSTNETIKLKNIEDLKSHFSNHITVSNFIKFNEERFNHILENSYNCYIIENWQISLIAKKVTKKKKGNGQGSTYFDNTRQCWVGEYIYNNKKKFIYQKKTENKTQFLARFNELLVSMGNGTYIEKRNDTVKSIIERHINQKFEDGITKGRAYKRDKQTLSAIEKCCDNFITKPIQQVTLCDIQVSKENMKNYYAQSVINKMWLLLIKAFSIASSPSVKLIPYNLMNDENLKKPTSNKKTKKILPLEVQERERLNWVLDNEERNHKYRNIVKMEWITGARIGEILARSKNDIDKNKSTLHIHNTLTQDKEGHTILGEHTKTYHKETGIDEGERYFPVSVELKKIIDEQLSNKLTNIYNLLFWDYRKNTFITPQEVNSWLKRINKKYNISEKSLHNHRLRHDRITQWKEAGMDLSAIQYLAGHIEDSNITDDVYIDISKQYAFEQLKKVTK